MQGEDKGPGQSHKKSGEQAGTANVTRETNLPPIGSLTQQQSHTSHATLKQG